MQDEGTGRGVIMKKLVAVLCVSALAATASAVPIILDDFEIDTSANYTIVELGGPDASAGFAYDYIATGIPLAPRSQAGDFGGLRMTANDSVGAPNAITAFHNTAIAGLTDYSLLVDVYIGITGTSGTTEHAHVGVAGDGATPNQLFSPISGTGHYVAFDGEGGSSSDYRHFKPSVGPVNSGDLSYLNDLNTTNSTGDTYQNLFPSPPYEFAGSPGNAWTTLQIDFVGGVGGTITYSLDGATGMTPIIQDVSEVLDGFVSLGHADLFGSVANPFQSQFVIYDNLEVIPEPSALALLGLGALAVLRRRG